jgi:hypothetical protein
MLSYAAAMLDGRSRNTHSSERLNRESRKRVVRNQGHSSPSELPEGDDALAQFLQVFCEAHAGKSGAGKG